MITARDPKEIAEAMISRSICSVMVGACLADKHGVHAWGWNNLGLDGYGLHAEAHCILRANRKRLPRSTLYVASQRARNSKIITSLPCPECQGLIKWAQIGKVFWRDSDGTWRLL